MTVSTPRAWHVARWPALAWLETIIKFAALVLGIAAGWGVLRAPTFALPQGWSLAAFIVLVILSLGLLAAIGDRWKDREVIAMIFVLINNLGHWGMVAGLLTLPWPPGNLLPFAGLMLLGDGVKLIFIRVHRFTVRDYSPAVLVGLTAVYIAGYAILIVISLWG